MNLIFRVAACAREIRDAIRYGIDTEHEQFAVAHGDVTAISLPEKYVDPEGYWPTPEGVAYADRVIAIRRNWTPVAWRLYGIWLAIDVARTVIACEIWGHDWVDDSHGGPDSGCMAGHCRRCGFSFHHTLY